VRIIADEHLTGAPRDAVQARLDLWLKSHIERLLEALFRLAAAEDITGIARGIAFQLTEALGVLDRHKVADEVKGLDQPARATLRKYGVRFGAYHIYLPTLLKPGPRALATQLWALKHGGSERKGLEAIQQLAASGRTSIAADQEIAKVLYRTAGYRVCGTRAVRVDILERLADLIRPALAWRPGGAGAKPPGAIEGFGFTVTVGMTSLAGCSGEDFASVLRSLGYRMDKRPRPAEAPPAPVESTPQALPPVQATPEEFASTDEGVVATPAVEGKPRAEPPVEMTEAATADPPAVEETVVETAAPASSEPVEQAAAPAPAEVAELVIGVAEAPTLAVSAQAEGPAEDVSVPEPPPEVVPKTESAVDEFIEVWRPVRRDEHARKPRHERGPRQRHPRRQPEAPLVAAAPAVAEATSAPEAETHPRGRPEGSERPERERRADRPERRPRASRPQRAEQPQRRGGRLQRGERPDRAPHGDRPDRDPALRAKYIKGRGEGRDRRDREPDPNSPFAKLAALKEQLEANTKEPR
jgi:ATP-dependent RNA helicase SUPV3L1/SUV3